MKIKLYKPTDYQREVHNYLKDSNNKSKIIVIKSVRQSGKSRFICMSLIYASLSKPYSTSIVISPSIAQNRKMLKDVYSCLINTNLATVNTTLCTITFFNNSEIIFKTAESGDRLRGLTCTGEGLLCFDEAAFISDEVFNNCTPFVNANKNNIIITSTPKFKQGFFYNLFTSEDKNIIKYDWAKVNNPFITEEQKQRYKAILPTLTYLREYEGLFQDNNSTIFGDISGIIKDNSNNISTILSIDWGTGSNKDYTALTLLDNKGNLNNIFYFNDKDVPSTIEYIINTVKKYNINTVVFETNSIGKIYGDMLKRELKKYNITIREFTTTNNSKKRIIDNLIVKIQSKSVYIPDNKELLIELGAYRQQALTNGNYTYNAEQGYHDDIIMSYAIGLDSINKRMKVL